MALTDAQIKKQWYWTNGCFRRALLDRYDSVLSNKEKRYNLPQLKELLKHKELTVNSPEINELYKKNLLAMQTRKLNLVLQAAEDSNRKQETIDAIMTELFERSVNSETKGSHES